MQLQFYYSTRPCTEKNLEGVEEKVVYKPLRP